MPAYTILMVFALAVSAFGAVIDSYLTPQTAFILVEKVI
jgi:hypothetical protein